MSSVGGMRRIQDFSGFFVDTTRVLCGDALIIVTEWKEFRSPDFDHIKATLKHPVIFDGRNLYDPAQVRGLGFEYLAIGR